MADYTSFIGFDTPVLLYQTRRIMCLTTVSGKVPSPVIKWIADKTGVLLFRWACHGPGRALAWAILHRMNWQRVTVENLGGVAERSLIVADEAPFSLEAPRGLGITLRESSGTFPKVRAHVLHSATATAYSPAVLLGAKLYLPDALREDIGRTKTDTGGLFDMHRAISIGRMPPRDHAEGGILVGGAGAYNWYHFIIECLPKAFLARRLPAEFDDLPLLVPDECRRVPSFSKALGMFSGGRPLRFIARGEHLLCDRLVLLDDVSVGPFNLEKGHWPKIEDYSQHEPVLRAFLREFRQGLLGSTPEHSKGHRLFLRRPGQRRNYNQDELIEISRRYGFEEVSPETLPLEQQAAMFAGASAIVGASGAAWVGMVFRESPLVGLSWLPRVYSEFCGYSALARLLNHRLFFVEAKTRRTPRSTSQLYSAGYRVCPVEFEAALKGIVSS